MRIKLFHRILSVILAAALICLQGLDCFHHWAAAYDSDHAHAHLTHHDCPSAPHMHEDHQQCELPWFITIPVTEPGESREFAQLDDAADRQLIHHTGEYYSHSGLNLHLRGPPLHINSVSG